MDTALETVFSTALCNTKLIVQDALSGLTMERDVALMRVRLLEAEKVKVEESITRLEGELVEASFNSAAEKDTKEKLQQRVRAVERVNALLTDRMNEACFDLNKKKQPELQPSQPPTYHEQNLLAVNQSYKEEITQLRRHNTLLAGQVRLLQEHIQGSSPRPPFMTVAQTQNPPTNLSHSQNRQLENYRRAKRAKEA